MLVVLEVAWCLIEVSEEEAHGLVWSPATLVDSARMDVCRFEGFNEVAELVVGGVAGVGEGLLRSVCFVAVFHWCRSTYYAFW